MLVERRAFELGLDERRPRDVWRRLHFVLDQARVFTDAYGTDLRRYLAWAELQSAEDARVVEAILPETDDDAVRIMTVHASKGLEFPVVVLSGLNTEYRSRASASTCCGATPGPRSSCSRGIDTAGLRRQLAEREQRIDEHEQLRLLYVAATRARDHLIVSLHHKARPPSAATPPPRAAWPREHAERWRRLDPVTATTAPPTTPATRRLAVDRARPSRLAAARRGPTTAEPAPTTTARGTPPRGSTERAGPLERRGTARARWRPPAWPAWPATTPPRPCRLATGRRPRRDRPTDEIADAGEPRPTEPRTRRAVAEATPWRRGRAGTAIGRAVHAVLQTRRPGHRRRPRRSGRQPRPGPRGCPIGPPRSSAWPAAALDAPIVRAGRGGRPLLA